MEFYEVSWEFHGSFMGRFMGAFMGVSWEDPASFVGGFWSRASGGSYRCHVSFCVHRFLGKLKGVPTIVGSCFRDIAILRMLAPAAGAEVQAREGWELIDGP
eukprot:2034688-Alexandrium_andersonii.AAC.1